MLPKINSFFSLSFFGINVVELEKQCAGPKAIFDMKKGQKGNYVKRKGDPNNQSTWRGNIVDGMGYVEDGELKHDGTMLLWWLVGSALVTWA